MSGTQRFQVGDSVIINKDCLPYFKKDKTAVVTAVRNGYVNVIEICDPYKNTHWAIDLSDIVHEKVYNSKLFKALK